MNARLSQCVLTIALAAMAALALPAQASVLTFTNMVGTGTNQPIPQDYGDNIATLPGGAPNPNTSYTYGTTYGITPDIEVAYGTDPAVGGPAPVNFPIGDLPIALNPDNSATITFTADPGFLVKLYDFDWAVYAFSSGKVINLLQVIVNGTPEFSQTNVTVPTSGHDSFSSLTGATPPYIGTTVQILIDTTGGNAGYVGFDNIAFAEGTPEPASMTLLAAGSLLLLRRRRV